MEKVPPFVAFIREAEMRLFVAVLLDEEIKTALAEAEEALSSMGSGKFSKKDNLHLTLAFIGETDRREDIEKVLSGISFPGSEFSVGGTGRFEKGILFARAKDSGMLSSLAEKVRKALASAGIPAEEMPFVPHITLARKFRENADFSEEKADSLVPEMKTKISGISLMESLSTGEGVIYREIFSKSPAD